MDPGGSKTLKFYRKANSGRRHQLSGGEAVGETNSKEVAS